MSKKEPRKAFNFYRSYYDVANELPVKDRLPYLMAILDRQFEGIEPDLKGIASFAYKSQKHSIESQVSGYESYTGEKLIPSKGGATGGVIGGSVQVQEKVQEKEEVEYTKFLNWFNNQKKIHTGTAGKFKVLSKRDVTNLNRIKKGYTVEDMTHAMEAMHDPNQWAMVNDKADPSHFLALTNFNKYLNTKIDKYANSSYNPNI